MPGPAAITEPKPDPGPPCPGCKKPLDAKSRCWKCDYRSCLACGKPTGTAFIAHCVECGQRRGEEVKVAVSDGPGEEAEPSRRWVVVLEARGEGPPTSVRIKLRIKEWMRYYGLYAVAFRLDLPEGTCTEEPLEPDDQ